MRVLIAEAESNLSSVNQAACHFLKLMRRKPELTDIFLEGSPPIRIHVSEEPVVSRFNLEKKIQTRELGYREFGMGFLYRNGLDVTGSVLNCGSAEDRFKYSRFFPKCTRYRLFDKDTKLRAKLDIVADVQDMPLPSDSEDCIVAFAFFFLLDRSVQEKALQEFRRVLKPDGLLLIDFFGPGSWYNRTCTHYQAIELCEKEFQLLDVELYCQDLCRRGPGLSALGKHLFSTFIKASPRAGGRGGAAG